MKFTEEKFEDALIKQLEAQGYPYVHGEKIVRTDDEQVLIEQDLLDYLLAQYKADGLTQAEAQQIVRQLKVLPASDLYESNRSFCTWLANGFAFKRDDRSQKDLHIQLVDSQAITAALPQLFETLQHTPLAADAKASYNIDGNIYKVVSQLEIIGTQNQARIPDVILYVNGLPLVVFELKSAIRPEATIFEAYEQLHTRYRRDIPKLFVYNAFCIISDGVNSKMGNLFAPYEFYYAWRKITGNESVEKDGIDALHTMVQGLFNKARLLDVCKNFVFFPDASKKEIKIVCRYPQYYAARKLFANILKEQKPQGSGKGGTYFGATGCGKSYTMQFLARLLMKSVHMESPTIVLITDRTDLDDQISKQFEAAKTYIGDEVIISIESRDHLREQLQGRSSGGVFLTTIHKFTEDIQLLTERSNVICISDEAHRSQVNLDKKVQVVYEDGRAVKVKESYGFAKYLHDSLPNATYVGFTGTPIDATLDVFGQPIDSYTMTEAVNDEITVRIVYEGRAAKVVLDNHKLEEIEQYYNDCADAGANEHQIEESKKTMANMNAILGDPDRIQAIAQDFVAHYEQRIDERSTVCGKAMFVSSSRDVAYLLYQALKKLRPEWFEVLECAPEDELSDKEKEKIMPLERVKMVMTRGKDDPAELYDLLGSKDYRKVLDGQFKQQKSNFKIAIVVDMWLTGFDVPFLDTIYIDKPIQKHNLIQTISRVNRKFEGKPKGLVVDYIGIKRAMNLALAQFSKADETNFEDIAASVIEVKNHLDLLRQLFHHFNSRDYFSGDSVAQLNCINRAAEYVLCTKKGERRFIDLVKRLKAAYDICCGSQSFSQSERDLIHFYLAVRSIVLKLTKGEAPDAAQMNAKVRNMIAEALHANGVEEIIKAGEEQAEAIDIFDEDYLARVANIKLPNTKIEMLKKMLQKAIGELKKTNQMKGIDFSEKLQSLVQQYNERKENDMLNGDQFETFTGELMGLIGEVQKEFAAHDDLGIDFKEKAFLDILLAMANKYDFSYPDDKMLELAKRMKALVDDKEQYPDWAEREDIKAELEAEIMMLLAEFGYPPIAEDDVYLGVIEQAKNFRKYAVVL